MEGGWFSVEVESSIGIMLKFVQKLTQSNAKNSTFSLTNMKWINVLYNIIHVRILLVRVNITVKIRTLATDIYIDTHLTTKTEYSRIHNERLPNRIG